MVSDTDGQKATHSIQVRKVQLAEDFFNFS